MTNGIACQDQVQIRYIATSDYEDVLDIECHSFESPHTYESLVQTLRRRDIIGVVIELDRQVLGYAFYQLHKHHLEMIRLAVAPRYRRMGLATQILTRLIGKLDQQRRTKIVLNVDEALMPCHLLLSKVGFFAFTVNRESRTYCFEYHV